MTTYHQALKRARDGRFDFTSSTGSSAPHPIGYCAGWKEPATGEEAERLTKQFGPDFVEHLNADIEAKREHQAKYHTDGHATEDEAHNCYRRYLLDQELELRDPPESPGSLHKCQAPGCGAYTAGEARLGHGYPRRFYLCDAHRSRETVEALVIREDGE